MSREYLFLLTRHRMTTEQVRQVDRIVKTCGGHGFVYPGDMPGNQTRGWCTGPNYGSPFNEALRRDVLFALTQAGFDYLF